MRQIKTAARCLSIALILIAAFVTLLPAEPASARYSRADLEYVCVAQGGIYWESFGITGFSAYGCWYPEGDEDTCYEDAGTFLWCDYSPAPEDNMGDLPPGPSQPVGGQLVDQNQSAPAPSAPAGSSHPEGNSRSGFETKMAWQ